MGHISKHHVIYTYWFKQSCSSVVKKSISVCMSFYYENKHEWNNIISISFTNGLFIYCKPKNVWKAHCTNVACTNEEVPYHVTEYKT